MSKTSFLRATVVASLLAWNAGIPAIAHADPAPPRVSIKVYDHASTGDRERAAAVRTAASIFRESGVDAAWFDCTGDSVRPLCGHLDAERELVVRIAPTVVAGTIVSRGSIESRSDRHAAGLVLGFAIVEPTTGAGALATIFLDRIHAITQRTSVSVASLLGRAMAHEVGHLLLGTNVHSRSGLMREIWTDAELIDDHPSDWLFAPTELEALEPYTNGQPETGGPQGPALRDRS